MPHSSYKAIGILDSGVGGLTVFQELTRQLPHEQIVYFGDTARMPYGPRPDEEVRRFALQIIDFLQNQEIKMVVVACNTATAVGLSSYRERSALPVLGVIEPGVRAALKQTRKGRVGVIGTAGTVRSSAYEKALQGARPGLHVTTRACPLFVLLVENDLVDTPEAEKVAAEYLAPFSLAAVDTLILGCTHYPLMAELIQKTVGSGVTLINSAEEIAGEVKSILTERHLHHPLQLTEPGYRFFVSGNPHSFEEIATKMLHRRIKAYQVTL